MSSLKRLGLAVFRWSWVVTLPITVVFVVWLLGVQERYSDFGLRYGVLGKRPTLWKFGKLEFDQGLRAIQLKLKPKRARADDLRSVRLFISETDEKQLQSRA